MHRLTSFISNPFRRRHLSTDGSDDRNQKEQPSQGNDDPLDIDDFGVFSKTEARDASNQLEQTSASGHEAESSYQFEKRSTDTDLKLVNLTHVKVFSLKEPLSGPPPSPQPSELEPDAEEELAMCHTIKPDDGRLFQDSHLLPEEPLHPKPSTLSHCALIDDGSAMPSHIARPNPSTSPTIARALRTRYEATGRQFWAEILDQDNEKTVDKLYGIRCSIKELLEPIPGEWTQYDLYLLGICRDRDLPKEETNYIGRLLESSSAVKKLHHELLRVLHAAKPPRLLRKVDLCCRWDSFGDSGKMYAPQRPSPLRKELEPPPGFPKDVRTLHCNRRSLQNVASATSHDEPHNKTTASSARWSRCGVQLVVGVLDAEALADIFDTGSVGRLEQLTRDKGSYSLA
ncbi:uncharacterized protein EI97DRAFT_428661 [Westerdykella ornata]|uniref:Uncharacterized protein n=1 Tax=Westerdykella ornata TaxID=318751 RepID=A0A6A6JWX6_WESOR|nr:uncharacterized protein EI97DRAFT_428661 [Westerdykella ornata]KAF2280573.1 hypothetical protein EI97DRAFT_428661 [Westerdykella ornata]